MKASITLFPGTNCEHDIDFVLQSLGFKTHISWYKDTNLNAPDVVIVPGGFSYGDYLRTGALAKVSPVMKEVAKFAEAGGLVIGICNGFQILCEANLLPGVLLKNSSQKFISKTVNLKTENTTSKFSSKFKSGEVISAPVAHFEGNYFVEPGLLNKIEDNDQVAFRYSSSKGEVSDKYNLNGSVNSIAGVFNSAKNVLGLMPHPERVIEVNSEINPGLKLFTSLLS